MNGIRPFSCVICFLFILFLHGTAELRIGEKSHPVQEETPGIRGRRQGANVPSREAQVILFGHDVTVPAPHLTISTAVFT